MQNVLWQPVFHMPFRIIALVLEILFTLYLLCINN